MRNVSVSLTFLFLVIASSSTFAEEKLNLVKAGEIHILINPIYPPMEFVDPGSGELSGFDIDLGKAIAARLGLKPQWSQSAFAQLQSSLQTRRGDIILSGMSDNLKRRESMDFIDYLTTGPVFFTINANAGTFKATIDFCGRKIAGSRSTSFSGDVAKWSEENCVAKGHPAVVYEGTEDSNAARLGMKQGRYDGVVQGIETIGYQMKVEPNTYKIVGDLIRTNDVFGIGISKSNSQLRTAVVNALGDIVTSGEYRKLLDKWGLTRNAVSSIMVNGVKAGAH